MDALDDVTVVSFGQLAQVPVATQLLADFGADIVKIEPPGGEWMRGDVSMVNAFLDGQNVTFLSMNRNKRSVELDLKDDDHREVAYELVEEADVVVSNFRPGVMERLGLGYEELSERNPGLVYCSSSGYGREGPTTDQPAQDLVVQGLSGLMSLNGHADDPPTPVSAPVVDNYTAMILAFAILAALRHRDRTGAGQRIDVDMLSSSIHFLMEEVTTYLNAGERPERSDVPGMGHVYYHAPYGVYETEDGYLTISLSPLSDVGDVLDLAELKAVSSLEEAYERRDELKELIESELKTEPTDHWLKRFVEADIWCGPVNSLPEALEHPQVEENDMIRTVEHPTAGTIELPGVPVRMSETPATVDRHPPLAGEHTEEVLAELGYSEAEIDELLDREA